MTRYAIIQIAVIAAASLAVKFLPFILFPSNRKRPDVITYLGTVLPYASMGMLVVYCFKNAAVFVYPYGIPEITAVLVVVFSYLWKNNSLVSIFLGTAAYMAILRFI